MRESRQLLRSTRGAFDLPSIITAVVVVGILTAGVFAAVFGVIPWAQDNAAKQDLTAVRTAEGVHLTKDGSFHDAAGLAAAQYLPRSEKVDVSVNTARTCYVGLAKSGSGKVFYSTDKSNEPYELTPTTVIDGKVPGCLAKAENAGLVDEVGGFDDGFYEPIGEGPGTEKDPGIAVKTPAPLDAATPTTTVTDGPVRVVELTVYGDSVEVTFQNTGSTSYRMPYRINVACRSNTTGAVTVEQLNGYFDLNSRIISGLSLIACIPGTSPVDVWVPTYYNNEIYRWRTTYVYNYAEPVRRGVTASAAAGPDAWCIENRSNTNAAGNPVDLAVCADKDGQRWQWSGDGAIRQSTLADKCLAADAGHRLVLGACDGTGSQHFKAEPFQGKSAVEGLVQIRVLSTGECVDIPGGMLAGVQLATAACNSSASQSWYMPGVGRGGEIVPPEAAPPALVVASLGSVSYVNITNTGSDLNFHMGVPAWNVGRVTATHVDLTCLSADKRIFQVSELRTVVATSAVGIGSQPRMVTCGEAQIISYSIKPVTSAGLRTVSNPQEFKGWSPADTASWDAAGGYPTVGEARSPVVVNTGSDLKFTINIPAHNTGLATTTHYHLTCLAADRSTYQINDSVTAVSPDMTGGNYVKTVTCGTGQIIEYTLQPLTLEGLKGTANPLATTGYTTASTFRWSAATDGYVAVGSVSSPIIANTGSDLTFSIGFGSYKNGYESSTHYKLTCLGADLTTYQRNGVVTAMETSITGGSYAKSVTCGEGQIIGYTLEPLTLDGLKEAENLQAAGGYAASGAYQWTSADGFMTVGAASAPTITNAGSDVTFTMKIGTGTSLVGKTTSTHYKVTCRDTAGNTRQLINTANLTSTSGYFGETGTKVVTCGADKVVAYTLQPLTLAGLKEMATPMSAGGYTTSGYFIYTKP